MRSTPAEFARALTAMCLAGAFDEPIVNVETVTMFGREGYRNPRRVAVSFVEGVCTEVRVEYNPLNANYEKRWHYWRKIQVTSVLGNCARRAVVETRADIGSAQSAVEYRFTRKL